MTGIRLARVRNDREARKAFREIERTKWATEREKERTIYREKAKARARNLFFFQGRTDPLLRVVPSNLSNEQRLFQFSLSVFYFRLKESNVT